MKAALEVIDRVRPDVVVGFGGYVSVPAYLAARKRKLPLVVHEGNALPGIANKLGARFTRHVATSFPDTDLPHARYIGLPIRRMISTLDRAALRAEGREQLRPRPRPADAAGHRRVAGGTPAQPVGGGGRARLRRGRRPGAARRRAPGRGASRRPRPAVRRTSSCRSSAGWTSRTPPPTPCVCRAGSNTVTEVSGVGLPAIFVPLPIGNGEQALNARPVVDAGGGLLVADAALTPEWVSRAVPDLLTDPDRLAAMSAAAAQLIPLDADEKLADLIARGRADEGPGPRHAAPRRPARHGCTSSASAAPGCPASPASCSPAASPSPAATPRSPGRSRRCARSAPPATSATTPPTSATPTRWSSRRPSARTTPRSWPRIERGLRLLPRSAALESVMQGRTVVAVAGTHGKTTTTSLLTVALQHCGADPSFAIGGDLNETGSNAHDGSGELFVAEADESDGAFLVYSPARRAGHQRRGRPPRQLRHARGLPRRLRHLHRPGLARRLPGGLRRRPGRRRAGPHGGRAWAGSSYAWGSGRTPRSVPRTCASSGSTSTGSPSSTAAAGWAR